MVSAVEAEYELVEIGIHVLPAEAVIGAEAPSLHQSKNAMDPRERNVGFAGKRPYRTSSRRFLAASLAQLGQWDEARREAELYLVNNPHFTISHWVSSQPIRDQATCDHFVEGFRKAGLPD